ncbi:DUF421 domain-containing protein [Maribacter sp. 2210JD10-5]|uniref:DUF421 domain-containing protein n=1 Tax=Maribacter sp. 2210JD10-5 TaxID=3386272 RepID=UPI0039BD0136
MKEWILSSTDIIGYIILSAIGIYVAVILFTRIFGKRSFSKMSSFDFAVTIAIGSIIASTLLSSSVSLLEGLVGLATVYLLQGLVAFLRRYKLVREIVDNPPLLIMEGKEILWENLEKANVTEDDLKAKLREANVIELTEVLAVVFEATGDIAVLHAIDSDKTLEPWLLEGVARN